MYISGLGHNLVKKISLFLLHFSFYSSSGFSISSRPVLPLELPKADTWGVVRIPSSDVTEEQSSLALTIVPELQEGLNKYIRNHGNPISAVVLVDVASGSILAMAQGKDPETWGAKTHSALYEGFPAASIFKMVTTLAAIDVAELEPDSILGLTGGCAKVHPRGLWLRDVKPSRYHKMSLGRAFANSCNSFYAKLSMQYLGLGVLNNYARKLGWGSEIKSDFFSPPSPIQPPIASSSAVHTVGKYAAGFGMVGLSPVHAAWINLLIARNGEAASLSIFAKGETKANVMQLENPQRLISEKNSFKMREMMRKTVRSGTASSAFRSWKMRKVRGTAAGKTGTLNGRAPLGLTTWFVGLMPYNDPQVVVSAVVVNKGRWVIKGANLAAEGFRLWHDFKAKELEKAVSQKSQKSNQIKG